MHTENQTYDCALIGGGLAGLAAAILLAEKGYRVIIFEKEKYPFHKVCGEYISMESFGFLEKLGVPLSSMDVPRISQLVVSAPDGTILRQTLSPGGFGISRYTLDACLADIAEKKGVKILQNTKVEGLYNNRTIRTPNGAYSAELILATWGKRSNMDLQLKRKFVKKPMPKAHNYVGVKYHVRYPIPLHEIQLHNFENGYCGISHIDSETCCLCYITSASNLEKWGSISAMEREVLKKNAFLKHIFENAQFCFAQPLTIAQISFASKELYTKDMVFVGDAAGMIAPLCGNGMSMALLGAQLLVTHAFLYLDGHISYPLLCKKYREDWNKLFAQRVQTGRIIQQTFGNKVLTNWVLRGLRPFPLLVKKLIALTHG